MHFLLICQIPSYTSNNSKFSVADLIFRKFDQVYLNHTSEYDLNLLLLAPKTNEIDIIRLFSEQFLKI